MKKCNKPNIKAVLFDLDGTLLDTEPDFIFCMNKLLKNRQKTALQPGSLKRAAAYGSAEMIKIAFEINEERPEFNEILKEFLSTYEANIAQYTKPFPGILEVLDLLMQRKILWGIVTNKLSRLTHALIEKINFPYNPACIISGDSLAFRKPHPEPLRFACQQLNLKTKECIYIGDTDIDIKAANQAQIPILFAEYGYLSLSKEEKAFYDIAGFIKDPREIMRWLDGD